MVPDYISEKVMKEVQRWKLLSMHGLPFLPDCISKMKMISLKFYGRFNQGVVTFNLVDVACSSGKDMDKFWKIS